MWYTGSAGQPQFYYFVSHEENTGRVALEVLRIVNGSRDMVPRRHVQMLILLTKMLGDEPLSWQSVPWGTF
jgi:hypothetical protein